MNFKRHISAETFATVTPLLWRETSVYKDFLNDAS